MTALRWLALPSAPVAALRAGGLDANGQPPERHVSDGDGNSCRHCLEDIAAGVPMLILAWRPFPAPQPYAELGRLRVSAIRGKTAIAVVEFSCAPMVAGDIVAPFQEKPPLVFRPKTAFERFPAGQGSVTGRVVMAKDFDYIVATGQKVYISAGADKGVKVGDYFRAVRTYDPAKVGEIEALSYKVSQSEETQKYRVPATSTKFAELPKRALAEMIVISVSPTSSTAMITFAMENVTVGDDVELEGGSRQ